MKPDNVFKFISVRKPDPKCMPMFAADEIVMLIASPGVIGDYRLEVTKKIDGGSSFLAATREVAKECMESDEYFSRYFMWNDFIKSQQHFENFINAPDRPDKARDIKTGIENLYKVHISPNSDLDGFLDSNSFPSMHRQIWRSYFSNVLLPGRRPYERNCIIFWICFFELLEAIRQLDPTMRDKKKKEKVEQLTKNFQKLIPTVPLDLISKSKINTEGIPPVEDNKEDLKLKGRIERIKKLELEISELQQAKSKLNDIHLNKIANIKAANEKMMLEKGQQPFEQMEKENRPLIIPEKSIDSPFRVSEKDFGDEQNDTLAILKKNQISVEGNRYDQLLSEIENKVALKFRDYRTLRYVTEIKIIGGVPVKKKKRIY